MKRETVKHARLFLVGIAAVMALSACSGGGGKPRAQIPALTSPADMQGPAAAKNNEGVDHLVQGHYKVALKYFKEAIAAKPDFAEAHFNMGVSLDGMGKHADATAAIKKAKEFGGSNQKIVENAMLKKHLNL